MSERFDVYLYVPVSETNVTDIVLRLICPNGKNRLTESTEKGRTRFIASGVTLKQVMKIIDYSKLTPDSEYVTFREHDFSAIRGLTHEYTIE